MADTRDSSISPMTRSPRTSPPPEKEGQTFSPLRQEQRAHGSADEGAARADDANRPGTAGSIKFEQGVAEPKTSAGFPFPAANGDAARPPHPLEPSPSFGQIADPTDFNPHGQLSRNATSEAGASTPGGRRSVQFARSQGQEAAVGGHSRQHSLDDEEEQERQRKDKASIIARLRALNPLQGHSRSISGFTIGDGPMGAIGDFTPTGPLSPDSERSQPRYIPEEGSEAEADDESAGEGPSRPPRQRRKIRRQKPGTAPATPKTINDPSFLRDSPSEFGGFKPPFARRGTMSNIPENQRMGLSEDEGRDMLAKESAWRRGLHARRRLSFSSRRVEMTGEETPDSRRPSNFRRFTNIANRFDGSAESPWRQRGERTTSISAQKWRQLKSGLKMLGKQRKEQNRIDHAKSAELVAELLAGAPAALFLASMFQRDEHGHKRVPILMEQLKVLITDSQKVSDKGGDRHVNFRIELEYGSGMTRMKWVIHRTIRDFGNLHIKYKTATAKEKYVRFRGEDTNKSQLPRFPRSALPYVRGMRGLLDDQEEDDDDEAPGAVTDGDASGTERPGKGGKRRRSSFKSLAARRNSSVGSPEQAPGIAGEMTARTGSFFGQPPGTTAPRKDTYHDKQRKKLEQYLQQLITFVIFRPDSNRLCKFLELSALGVRLAQEGGYHGKEGFMMIQSNKAANQKGWNPHWFKQQAHMPKWFLVRHSYVCCVDSPEEMNIYDVFLVDPDFCIDEKKGAREMASKAKTSAAHPNAHMLRLVNSERKLKLLAKNERQMGQFQESIKFMMSQTEWSRPHRFDSFAPVRYNVWAQWLVDARDYMWNVSRAISMARDVIYIHDWWLSPELYLRRPPAISQKWRLDRLLQRKAQEGVKIFVIMYRNINSAIPIDSEYSKLSLLDLHPNVFVQRSPHQIKKNQFFWAHHEKICIVDHTVAFCGGVDLCFGRWDTPKHVLNDDKLTGFELDNNLPKDSEHCQMWPGKDYSNPRVHDFYALDKPYEEMYDREKVPRMPWHDIGMQIVGQPARDLTRHFVQRWNYLRRGKTPTRPTPYLLPPPDFDQADLRALGLDGTCEIQILRSACKWSLGTPDRTEHSIMNAYVKSIQASDHFVYIENQFYISSCYVEGTKILNMINDALVERIRRAHSNGEAWRAVLVIPLMPGFQSTVDSQDGTSVRLIMQCQYRSICRGESSLFGRLRAVGIEPEDYVQFYSLRSWGHIGPKKSLCTEQLYIHAKCMVVDDRIVIIGSANINERSMLGSRDSEVAAIVRDTDMIPSFMAGKPYKVSKFAHTLRVRLMREHLGIDVDELLEEEQSEVYNSDLSRPSSADTNSTIEQQLIDNKMRLEEDLIRKAEAMSYNHDAVDHALQPNPVTPDFTTDPIADTEEVEVHDHAVRDRDVRGEGADHFLEASARGYSRGRDSTIDIHGHEVLLSQQAPEGKNTLEVPKQASPKKGRNRSNTVRSQVSQISDALQDGGSERFPPPSLPRMTTRELGLTQLSQLPALPTMDDTDIGGPPLLRTTSANANALISALVSNMKRPLVTDDCMLDPINDTFLLDTWHTIAENNTKIYRQVFRCMPDNEVRTWKEYREYAAFGERFAKSQGAGKSETRMAQDTHGKTGPPGTATTFADGVGKVFGEKLVPGSSREDRHSGNVEQWAEEQERREQSKPSTAASNANGSAGSGVEFSEKANGMLSPMSPMDGTNSVISSDAPPSRGANDDANGRPRTITITAPTDDREKANGPSSSAGNLNVTDTNTSLKAAGSQRRRKRAGTRGSMKAFQADDDNSLLSKQDAEELLGLVQGHLVSWPYDWLEKEEAGGGWLYPVDQIAPLEI
ncbi:Phospholipase D1 [Diplodia intermedia]|uniref:phospholipase D n=1 Tax=Diplodia intermedia TaxID=856260 RepID=A0ABR3U3A9_9PEZI